MSVDLQPLWLTLRLAIVTTTILLLMGVPFAWWLASTQTRLKPALEAMISMPLVLPPSVLGFYLLLVFSPQHWFGGFLDQSFGIRLAFSFEGLVVASCIFSFPFMVQPIQAAIQAFPQPLLEAAYGLGKSKYNALWHVVLPNIKSALLSGAVLAFAHTIGEFGVVLMIGGNLPEETRVASIAIYNEVEALHYGAAHFYSGILVGLSFLILFMVYWLNRSTPRAIR